MSKGNMLLGYARGSVGDVVMSRVKGQQVAKARNRKPANPKTRKQMAQRSAFINPVKFYTHGVQALFTFAFSDKKTTESDYNAFMRNNSKASYPAYKSEFDSTAYPALGNYQMTKGKLAELPTFKHPASDNANPLDLVFATKPSSVGDVSAALVAAGLADEGDIITMVSIDEDVLLMTDEVLTPIPGNSPKWTINQFVVDSASTQLFSVECPSAAFLPTTGGSCLEMKGYYENKDTHLHSVAFIRSKETDLGLEVSTSYLKNGGHIDAYIEHRNTPEQVAKVLADWGATGDAILQGSIAKK